MITKKVIKKTHKCGKKVVKAAGKCAGKVVKHVLFGRIVIIV